jgi:pyridoxamine 5'-phosphate oxidase
VISDLRREYASRSLGEADTDPNPIAQFRVWFDEALKSEVIDANAMSLATASTSGEPSVRTVLLKELDERGFVFYTQYDSAKGRDLTPNPRAALLFYWAPLERQVRITGRVDRVPRAMSEAYFATRPVESQWGAWTARQSSEVDSREWLEQEYAAVRQRYATPPIPCPPDWGGYRVEPERIEFWQGRPGRLHDRLLYTRQHDGTWTRVRLAP